MDLRLLTAGIVAVGSVAGLSSVKANPPARLRYAGPAQSPVARGLAPEAAVANTSWMTGPTSTTVRPLFPTQRASLNPAPPSSLAADWAKLKSAITGTAPNTQEAAARSPVGPPPTPTHSADVYAGKPAYRWYGWGAMKPPAATPAPPRTSAEWLTQTGATPGAFPSVAANSDSAFHFNPEPANQNPPRPVPPPAPVFRPELSVSFSNVPPLPPGAVLISEGPPVPVFSTPMPANGLVPQPLISVPPRATTEVPVAAPQLPQPPVPTAWQSVPATEEMVFSPPASPTDIAQAKATLVSSPTAAAPPIQAAVIPAAEWNSPSQLAATHDTPPLHRAAAEAVIGLAKVTAIRFPAPGRAVVVLTARSPETARAAAELISKLPQARPLAVEFQATITAN